MLDVNKWRSRGDLLGVERGGKNGPKREKAGRKDGAFPLWESLKAEYLLVEGRNQHGKTSVFRTTSR